MSDPITARPPRRAPGAGRRWVLGAVVAVAFLAGAATVSGVSAVAAAAGMMGHDHMAAVAHVNAALDAAGATADQKSRIETILHAGLKPLMDAHHMGDLHGDLVRLLTAPTIDRGALEQLRAGEIATLDQASRSAIQSLADAAEVLSPDQRAKLASVIAEHHPGT
jgi:Spy/CpxP family protein refolding chaperone